MPASISSRAPIAFVVVLLTACGPGSDASKSFDSAAAAASVQANAEAGSTLATRDEAQADLEAARESFLADDLGKAASHLWSASEISARHALTAADPAKSALLQSANGSMRSRRA